MKGFSKYLLLYGDLGLKNTESAEIFHATCSFDFTAIEKQV